ncbi:hypothetical protein HMPREF2811_03200 [Globicatella sp. HMSC072A10]|uniref:hypothetical protein n=1 Tax=Globicatella sp. HMSC072A10 TaxID=1739315 RepID=UPI0008D4AF6F|nr:hypothetical protein [Globicatella sp. HMSC072A10]OFK61211.1 hypothetical protein HMPREF2811_03200 [Globicatella sp. HMSC072A10]
MGKKLSNYLFSTGSFLIDATREAVLKHEDDAVQQERYNGAKILTEALFEAKINDDEIIRLLQKYYFLSEEECEKLMISERTVNLPCKELETYLVRSEGYTRDEAVNFIHEKGIPDFLRENKGAWKLSPGQLFSKIQ